MRNRNLPGAPAPASASAFVRRGLRDDPLVDEDEAARQLGLTPKTLQNWRCLRDPARWIPYVKLGGRVAYRQSALDAAAAAAERAITEWRR